VDLNRPGFLDTSEPQTWGAIGGTTSKQRYPEEFKTEAAKQITERGHKVADVSARLGVSQHSLYEWSSAPHAAWRASGAAAANRRTTPL